MVDSEEWLEEWLTVGKIVGVQGLQGELRVNPASDFPERFTVPGPRWVSRKGSPPREVQLKTGRQLPGKSLFVVRLDSINTRDAAEALVGSDWMVPADDRPQLAEGEFHLLDLVGLEARLSPDDDPIGTVSDLISGVLDDLVAETGLVPALSKEPHFDDQLNLYDALVRSPQDLTDGELTDYFKDASLLAPDAGDWESEITVTAGNRSVAIKRDRFGVPHIFGDSRPDALFGTGYVTGAEGCEWPPRWLPMAADGCARGC